MNDTKKTHFSIKDDVIRIELGTTVDDTTIEQIHKLIDDTLEAGGYRISCSPEALSIGSKERR